MSNSILAVLQDAENKLHALKNTWPCGIRSIDDETDRKIRRTKEFIRWLRKTHD